MKLLKIWKAFESSVTEWHWSSWRHWHYTSMHTNSWQGRCRSGRVLWIHWCDNETNEHPKHRNHYGRFQVKGWKRREAITVGPFEISKRNDRSKWLIEWCKKRQMTVMDTWFKSHPMRCWTWRSPYDKTKNQIDYNLMQERF